MTTPARFDPARGARVVARHPLLYARGADASVDRPAHVRAGSALAAFGGRLAIIQDDACFLALVDTRVSLETAMRAVADIPFPTDPDGVRQFDDTRGNKKRKLDLEAAFVTPDGSLLVALGSGSSALRERIVLVENPSSDVPQVTIVNAGPLYSTLRDSRAFSGSELNIEGAALVGDDVMLFQRGNGAALVTNEETIAAVDATARLPLADLVGFLRGGGTAPTLRDVVAWDLGSVPRAQGRVHPSEAASLARVPPSADPRLTFTDGVAGPGGTVAFLACAEDSPDATHDGPVSAVAIGCLDDRARTCELGLVLDERGTPLVDKAEGLAFDPDDPMRAFVVTDRDDPAAPSELLELRLADGWLP